uniref:hypothetical protein n=1 Tax=Nocardia miyunensis TaxID=282684 RepID=UPI000B2FA68C
MHPPSDPPFPDNVAKWGSADGVMDKAEAAANWSEAGYVAAYFDMHDWHFSSDLFGAYLGNHGADFNYILEAEYVRQIMNSADVKNTVLSQLDSIKAIARADPQIGVTREITAPWDVVESHDDSDLVYALGHFSVAIGSDTTVTKAED